MRDWSKLIGHWEVLEGWNVWSLLLIDFLPFAYPLQLFIIFCLFFFPPFSLLRALQLNWKIIISGITLTLLAVIWYYPTFFLLFAFVIYSLVLVIAGKTTLVRLQ